MRFLLFLLLLALVPVGAGVSSGLPERDTTLPDKYGFLGDSDAALAVQSRDKDAVILGRVYKCEKTRDDWSFHVEVVECYKGNLKPGDKILVSLQAETGPEPAAEIGKRIFFLLETARENPPSGATGDKNVGLEFGCDAEDAVGYERYVEKMRQAFLDIPKHEIAFLDTVLAPPETHVVKTEEDDAFEKEFCWPVFECVLALRWVSRAELLARRRYWERCLANHWIPRGVVASEFRERLLFFDDSVCEYRQAFESDPLMGDVGDDEGPYSDDTVWRRLVPPDKGFQLYKQITLNFSGLPKPTAPDDTSWCVIFDFIKDGKLMAGHSYVPSRLEVQATIHGVREGGTASAKVHNEDTAPADWMVKQLKYSRKLWY